MDDNDALEIAPVAIEKVARIATSLGATERRELCGRLGGELFIASGYLKSLERQEQNEKDVKKVLRFLRNIEKIFSGPGCPRDDYPCLRRIAEENLGSRLHKDAEEKIKAGLLSITAGKGTAAEDAILHIRRFTRHGGIKMTTVEEASAAPKSTPAEYLKDVKILVYETLREHMVCTCALDPVELKFEKKAARRHLARLLLRPTVPSDQEGNVHFDMLLSSTPQKSQSTFGRWQDIQVLVPRIQKPSQKPRKRARFAGMDDTKSTHDTLQNVEEILYGHFCNIIRLEADARLCFRIERGKMQRCLDSLPLKQVVEHAQTMSLATILQAYRLTAKMKAALAYILAQSVWQFYDSDWMSTRWTSETVQFFKEHISLRREGEPKLFASKPYVSVDFGNEDVDASESSSVVGELHRYPRVRSLGIMLVEIGIGLLLPRSEREYATLSHTAQINRDWSLATEISNSEDAWQEFDYRKYRTAVSNCLSPAIFVNAPFMPNASEEQLAEGLKKRRKILYDSVISPLEDLLQGTGWKDELDKIGPLTALSKARPIKDKPDSYDKPASSTDTKLKKSSKNWLKRIRLLNEQLKSSSIQSVPLRRVRIAILDTGYDADAVFFQNHTRRQRLVEWKDWVEESDQPKDAHGHGTHLISLVMKIAPDADICVARVAKNPMRLEESSNNVAEAIKWAESTCKADIVSMSFGYVDDQRPISKAIRNAVNDRDESIVFFSAAANFGANEKEMFPARHECVISIRGTNTNGAFQDFNPPRNPWENVVLGTLGLEVPSSCLSSDVEDVCKSGTSVATAVTAGIAGMLLGYVNSRFNNPRYEVVRNKLRTRQGMLAILDSIATDSLNNGYKYVTPWCLYDIDEEERWFIFEAALSAVSQ